MIEIDNSIISPEQLLDRVRKNVLNKSNDDINTYQNLNVFDNSNINFNVNEKIRTAQITAFINLNEPIKSHRKLFGPIIIFIKKVIRKTICWYAERLMRQQMRYNDAVVVALSEINNKLDFIIKSKNI